MHEHKITVRQIQFLAAPVVYMLNQLADHFCCERVRLFNYGIGIHLLQSEDPKSLHEKTEINPKDNHISFQVIYYHNNWLLNNMTERWPQLCIITMQISGVSSYRLYHRDANFEFNKAAFIKKCWDGHDTSYVIRRQYIHLLMTTTNLRTLR
jgi:hypothetical protein